MNATSDFKDLWSQASLQDLYEIHPTWYPWTPATKEPYIASVKAKMLENNHDKTLKCAVDPREARSLSLAQGVPEHAGFWLIPPLRAPSDVRIFSCGNRCIEAGTALIIPEHSVAYPAALGSTVLVRKGVIYGMGVLNTAENRGCCLNEVVVLRSTKKELDKKKDSEIKKVRMSVSEPRMTFNGSRNPLGPGDVLALRENLASGHVKKTTRNVEISSRPKTADLSLFSLKLENSL